MSGSGLHTYGPLVLHLLVAAILAGLISTLSVLIGWRRPNRAKQQAYECGMEPTGDAREPFSVKPGRDDFYSFRCGSDFSLPVGGCFPHSRAIWLLRDDDLHRDPAGRLFLSLEKGCAGLAYIASRANRTNRGREWQSKR